jgi:hypothetical protein
MAITAKVEIQGGDTLVIESTRTCCAYCIPLGGMEGMRVIGELVQAFTTDIEEGNGQSM